MTIGKLSAVLSLNSASFDTGARNSGRRVRTLRNEIQDSTSVLPKLQAGMATVAKTVAAAGAAAAAAAATGFYILRREMERLDKIGKTASKLGISTEALVGLQHAAGLAGIEQGKLDTSLQRLVRRLSEAAQGGGQAKDVLAELRLDASRLASLAPEQAIFEIADAMAGVANQGERVRMAFALFGREGVDLVRMMEGGSTSIRQAMADAEQLGLTFSSLDAAKVAAANDAMTRLRDSTGALKTALAIELAPVVATVADDMTTWLTSGSGNARGLANAIGTIVEAGAGVVDIFRVMKIHWAAFEAVVIRGMAELTGLMSRLPGLDRDYWTAVHDSLMADFRRYSAMVAKLEKQNWAKSIRDQVAHLKQDLAEGGPSAAATDLANLNDIQEQRRKMEELQRTGESMASALRAPQEILTDRIADANRMLDLGAIGWQTYTREIAAARAEFLRTQEAMSGLPALLEEGSQAFYLAMAKWNAAGQEMQQPLPGDDLVRSEQPQSIEQRLAEARAKLERQKASLRWEVAHWVKANPIPGDDAASMAPPKAIEPEVMIPEPPQSIEDRLAEMRQKLEEQKAALRADVREWTKANRIPGPEIMPTMSKMPSLETRPTEIDQGVFLVPGQADFEPPADQIVRVTPEIVPSPTEQPEPIVQRIEAKRTPIPEPPVLEPIVQRIEIERAAMPELAVPEPIMPEAIRQRIAFDVPAVPTIAAPETPERREVAYNEPGDRKDLSSSGGIAGRDSSAAAIEKLSDQQQKTNERLVRLLSEAQAARTVSEDIKYNTRDIAATTVVDF